MLYVRRGTRLVPLIHGGDQERRRRASTENVAGIVACGTALELVEQHRPATCTRLTSLRRGRRLPNNVNFCFRDVQGETILLELESEDVYASTGSACHAGSQAPSHVLLAIGRCPELAHTALRLTLGAPTTAAEVERVLELLPIIVDRLREKLIARR